MPDQAAGLRDLFTRRPPSLVVVAGGDAAKAAVALHLARAAVAAGRATVIVDATPGQIALACDLACRYELAHVVAGDVPLADVVRTLEPDLLLVPAARAVARYGTYSRDERARLAELFEGGVSAARGPHDEPSIDQVVVHAEAGEASRAIEAFGRDARVVVAVSDRDASLRAAYAEMKTLASRHGVRRFEIVAPAIGGMPRASRAYANLAATATRFLDVELVDGGSVPVTSIGGPAPIAPFAPPSSSHLPPEVSHAAVA